MEHTRFIGLDIHKERISAENETNADMNDFLGPIPADKIRKQARELRDTLITKLTSAQIAEAQRLAQVLVAK